MKPFLNKDFVVGLDLGSSSIKMVQLLKRETGLTLIKAELKEIDDEKEILPKLGELLHGVDRKRSEFIVSINCPKTAMRAVLVPPMPERELKNAIRLESKNYFPFPIDESTLDFEKLEEVTENGIKKIRLLVATSPKTTVESCLSILRKVGIRPISLIPVSQALRSLIEGSESDKEKAQCVVDLGQRYSELTIFNKKRLVFCRKIPVGGRDLTKALTYVLVSDRGKTQLTWDEAEKVKQEIGFLRKDELGIVLNKISASQIVSMLRSPLEQLASEINRSFDYYREESGGITVDSLVLFGRGALLQGLSQFISEAIGIEVKIGNPLEGLKIEMQNIRQDQDFSPFAVALGAALSLGRGVNLLPSEVKEEMKRALLRATVQSACATIILILAFIYIGMKIQLTNFDKRISVAQLELASLQSALGRAIVQGAAKDLVAHEPYWEEVFKELSNITPAPIYLVELNVKDKKISLRGLVQSSERERVLSDFMRNMENGIFENVKLVTAKETADKSASEFELECWVD